MCVRVRVCACTNYWNLRAGSIGLITTSPLTDGQHAMFTLSLLFTKEDGGTFNLTPRKDILGMLSSVGTIIEQLVSGRGEFVECFREFDVLCEWSSWERVDGVSCVQVDGKDVGRVSTF